MRNVKVIMLEWWALNAFYDIYNFVVYPKGARWTFKVKIDKRYANDGDSIIHHSSVTWSTSAEARNDAQRWLNNRLRRAS